MDLQHYEDFPVGRIIDCGTYRVSKDEILEFARAFDPQPHHLDEEAGKKSILGGLAASGWHVCAIAMRLFAGGVVLKAANRGGAGARECRWIKPVRPGDLLRLEAEVVETKPSQSKPFGFVTFDCRIFNETGQVAMVSMTPIIARRGA